MFSKLDFVLSILVSDFQIKMLTRGPENGSEKLFHETSFWGKILSFCLKSPPLGVFKVRSWIFDFFLDFVEFWKPGMFLKVLLKPRVIYFKIQWMTVKKQKIVFSNSKEIFSKLRWNESRKDYWFSAENIRNLHGVILKI